MLARRKMGKLIVGVSPELNCRPLGPNNNDAIRQQARPGWQQLGPITALKCVVRLPTTVVFVVTADFVTWLKNLARISAK